MTQYPAYWISPKGAIYGMAEKHINFIYSNPKIFGLNIDVINAIYKKHKEKLGWEGNAREEIMLKLIRNGWIRVRKIRNSWTLQAFKLNASILENIWDWTQEMVKIGLGKYSQIDVHEISSNMIVTKSADEIVKGKFLEEIRLRNKIKLLIGEELKRKLHAKK